MFSRALAVTVLALALSACAGRVVKEPYPVYVTVERPLALPAELLEPCPIHEQTGRTVMDYTYTALINTASLRLCAKKIDEIRKLQP